MVTQNYELFRYIFLWELLIFLSLLLLNFDIVILYDLKDLKFNHLNKKNCLKAKVMKYTGNLLTILQNLKNLFLVRAYGQLSQRCRTCFGYVEKIKIEMFYFVSLKSSRFFSKPLDDQWNIRR